MDAQALKIIETEQKFATALYKNFTSIRYGMEPCCLIDVEAATIKKELCDWKELKALTSGITGSSSISIEEIQNCDITNGDSVTTWTSADIQDLIDRLNILETSLLVDDADLNLVVPQPTPLSTWTITHNLGKKPSVRLEDLTGGDIIGEIDYTDNNTVVIMFAIPVAGTAYLN